MHLVSVQVGQSKAIAVGDRQVTTGIDKHAVAAAEINDQGVVGDAVMDTLHHGGPDQAVYLYSTEDHDWWQSELGRQVRPGEFGENLTVSSFGPDEPRVGDRYRVGDTVILELTAPRIPCAVLGAQMKDGQFAKRLRESRRPGAYARVLVPGSVTAGDSIERIARWPGAPTIGEMFEIFYDRTASRASLVGVLAAPIAGRARQGYEERLAGLE